VNIIYFGTAEFAVGPLETLVQSSHTVSLCVTQPDRKKGRGQKVQATPVKVAAERSDVSLYQPEELDTAAIQTLKKHAADVFIVAAYGLKLPPPVLELPKYFCVNIHPSLLPQYRGAAPIQWTILNGDSETGVTFIRMDERIDTGDILFQRKIQVNPREDSESLSGRLSKVSGPWLLECLKEIEAGTLKKVPQGLQASAHAPKFGKQDGIIHWTLSAEEIDRKVRALRPWPSATTHWQKKGLKVLEGRPTQGPDSQAGTVLEVAPEGITVACGQGSYRIERLQLESSRPMTVSQFLNGHKISKGNKLG
jgi:methionyl-tRNA formyltransferase